ncbi:calnexin-like isoform X3 [Anguilla rostrata]|uniref:calnexin-like isoform X3 n=1 Tax=Anguilla rostrata TaxID=7938 RepID=UPI0030CF241E
MLLQVVPLYFCLRLTLASQEEAKLTRLSQSLYQSAQAPEEAIFAETFDSGPLDRRWVLSKALKEGEEDVLKYDGEWALEEPVENSDMHGNRGLVLKSPGRHHAISAYLRAPHYFRDRPLILQYEVLFQNTVGCGGAYIKLLSHSSQLRLSHFNNATPYSIMFGPDKCGSSHKVHFIVCDGDPLTGLHQERHVRQPDADLKEYFSDQRPHLYTLRLYPDHSYEILIDLSLISKGSLLEDTDPPLVPPAEISDPSDKKPEDWDDRPLIPDPTATKPLDWDENAPALIPDPSAQRPPGWLVEELPFIPDPQAERPHDWDEDMDGKWEAPLISNPACSQVIGCGPWSPPMISNPSYKGKWRPPMIKNPNYQGQWYPRTIPNPAFSDAPPPFQIRPVAAVGLELWSVTGGVLFDNILLCDDPEVARRWTEDTWGQRRTPGLVLQLLMAAHKRPWLWGVYVFSVGLPIILFISVMWPDKRFGPPDMEYYYKKSDEPQADGPQDSEGPTNLTDGSQDPEGSTNLANITDGPRRRENKKPQKSDLELKIGK